MARSPNVDASVASFSQDRDEDGMDRLFIESSQVSQKAPLPILESQCGDAGRSDGHRRLFAVHRA